PAMLAGRGALRRLLREPELSGHALLMAALHRLLAAHNLQSARPPTSPPASILARRRTRAPRKRILHGMPLRPDGRRRFTMGQGRLRAAVRVGSAESAGDSRGRPDQARVADG